MWGALVANLFCHENRSWDLCRCTRRERFELGRLRFGGFWAWLLWLSVHIFYLIGFGNRVLVMLQWAFAYLTFRQRVRIITGDDPSAPLVGALDDPESVGR